MQCHNVKSGGSPSLCEAPLGGILHTSLAFLSSEVLCGYSVAVLPGQEASEMEHAQVEVSEKDVEKILPTPKVYRRGSFKRRKRTQGI